MTYVFGPVPSRRLGQSLGIDPIPMKTCNWNCVYCQLGRSSALSDRRAEYAPREEIIAETMAAIELNGRHAIDWLTFVGSGEPALHSSLGWMIRELKRRTDIPVAVITNGSLMDLPEVRDELCASDLVVPSLDAGSEALYRRINRSARAWSLERLVRGLGEFRAQFTGRIWVEVMLIRGVNDGEEALRDLAGALQRIGPDEVHLNLPVRPPAESWVEPPDDAGLARAVEVLGKVARVVSPKTPLLNLAGSKDVVETILQVVSRHPLAEEEIVQAIEQHQAGEPGELLKRLEASGRARRLERGGKGFWTGAEGRYVEKSPGRCHSGGRAAGQSGAVAPAD